MITELLIVLSITSLSLGQMVRIPLNNQQLNVYLWDVFLFLAIISWFRSYRQTAITFITTPFVREGVIFATVALLTSLISLHLFSVKEVTVGLLYLIRWTAYLWLTPMVMSVFAQRRQVLMKVLILTGMLIAIGGWIQLLIFPDISPLVRLGWDPHQSRLVSTLLDPNYSGAMIVITMVLISAYLLDQRVNWIIPGISLVFLYFSLIYTFSRSAYLMFLTSFLAIAYVRSWKVGLVAVLAFFISLQANPRVEQRVSGAITVDASAGHRLTSWDKARIIIQDNPLTGVGFNNYRYAQIKAGLIGQTDPSRGGHAGAGTDSSFLFIIATTGLLGSLAFANFLFRAFKIAIGFIKTDWSALASFAILFGLLFHSQFVNSLFYPPIMIYLFAVFGLLLGRLNHK